MEQMLFVPSVRETAWLADVLPGTSPAELPVAGEDFIDYALEGARKFGTILTEVLDWRYSGRLRARFAELTGKDGAVFYEKGEGTPPRGLNDLAGYASPLTQNMADGLEVVWGLYLTTDVPGGVEFAPATPEECADTPTGLYRLCGGRWLRARAGGLSVRGVADWYRVNLAVLHHAYHYTLPGYASANGVRLGRNVVLEYGADVRKSALLCDDTWCARSVRLGGDVILGRGSFIGEGTRVKNSVIGENTFVGADLDLYGKIVIGRRVIDARTGAWVDIDEPGIVRPVEEQQGGFFRRVWRLLHGASRGRRG